MRKNSVIKNSAMRFSLVMTSLAIFVTFMAIAFYIVMKTIQKEEPDWATMGVFAGGIAAVLTGVGWNKTKQKEIEIHEKE